MQETLNYLISLSLSLYIYNRNVCPFVCLSVCPSCFGKGGGAAEGDGEVCQEGGGNGERGFL